MLAEIIFAAGLLTDPHYLPAEGQCLLIREYRELAEVLHEGENWPYGRCNLHGESGFRLPNLSSKAPVYGTPWIKVK